MGTVMSTAMGTALSAVMSAALSAVIADKACFEQLHSCLKHCRIKSLQNEQDIICIVT